MSAELAKPADMPNELAAAFAELPEGVTARLLEVREIILSVASELPELGGLREYLAWGQPSYRAERDGVGTSVRLWVHGDGGPAMFVHCGTSLISEFRAVVGHLVFDGKRAVLLPDSGPLPEDEVRVMVEMALTSKLR